MNKYSEENYSKAGIVEAYAIGDLTFTTPFQLQERYLERSKFSIGTAATSLIIPLQKSEGCTVKESTDTGSEGSTRTVTLTFQVSRPTEEERNVLQQLRTAHHLLLTHLGGEQSIVRATAEGWQLTETGEDTLAVEITIHNRSGVQRIVD